MLVEGGPLHPKPEGEKLRGLPYVVQKKEKTTTASAQEALERVVTYKNVNQSNLATSNPPE